MILKMNWGILSILFRIVFINAEMFHFLTRQIVNNQRWDETTKYFFEGQKKTSRLEDLQFNFMLFSLIKTTFLFPGNFTLYIESLLLTYSWN